eukprot:CAMPEP_0196598528 /NCGR_PEP_ID=MMETSP1081-20130531/94371_1 /TAXON_ID=36882 /ORGANISM="Pyramimonas amylifera, Strain CCMP720" /LENGTH=587 /DNA_ID=CAMNT_0041924235 /DNA_START=1865 /DNA_END=3630 /DNA_ORIENTATION=+
MQSTITFDFKCLNSNVGGGGNLNRCRNAWGHTSPNWFVESFPVGTLVHKNADPGTLFPVTSHATDGIVLEGGIELKVKQLKAWSSFDEDELTALELLGVAAKNESEILEDFEETPFDLRWPTGCKRSRSRSGENLEAREHTLKTLAQKLELEAQGIEESKSIQLLGENLEAREHTLKTLAQKLELEAQGIEESKSIQVKVSHAELEKLQEAFKCKEMLLREKASLLDWKTTKQNILDRFPERLSAVVFPFYEYAASFPQWEMWTTEFEKSSLTRPLSADVLGNFERMILSRKYNNSPDELCFQTKKFDLVALHLMNTKTTDSLQSRDFANLLFGIVSARQHFAPLHGKHVLISQTRLSDKIGTSQPVVVLLKTFPQFQQTILKKHFDDLHRTTFYLPLFRSGSWALAKIESLTKVIDKIGSSQPVVVLLKTFPQFQQTILKKHFDDLHRTTFYLPLFRSGSWALAKIESLTKTVSFFDPTIVGVPQCFHQHDVKTVFAFLTGVLGEDQTNNWTIQQLVGTETTTCSAKTSILTIFCTLMWDLEFWSYETMEGALENESALRLKIQEMGLRTLAWIRGSEFKVRGEVA